jgi:nucleoid-associated protein YejK
MIKHFIIHEIIKSKGTKTAVFSPSKKEVTLDSVAETLVNELHEAVTKSPKKAFGHFSDAGTSYFRQEIDNYLSSNSQYNLLVNQKPFWRYKR